MKKKTEVLQLVRAEKIKTMEDLRKKGYNVKKIFENDKKGLMRLRSSLRYNRITSVNSE